MTTDERSPRFGLGVPNGGDFADPLRLADLAREAEQAGWDGIFIWDHVIRREPWTPMVDPWISLSAMAIATNRILLGPMVTPLPRRRVSNVARQTATLDVLSGGRLRLGVGLGAPPEEFTRFGEDADPKVRARKLDESIDALELLWTGEPVSYRGEHVVADGVQFTPRPVNGRVPIWGAGTWPGGAPFRRAARLDGIWPYAPAGMHLDVRAFTACLHQVNMHRTELGRSNEPFDACFVDRSTGPDDRRVLEHIDSLVSGGMTWWIESLDEPSVSFERHRARVAAGPPLPR